MTSTLSASELLSIVDPVLDKMPQGGLRESLFSAYRAETQSLLAIERSFHALTGQPQDAEVLRRFFQSWSQTNNSAACVAGLAGRITLAGQQLPEPTQLQYYRIADSLQRITDEDFGVGGAIVHSDLFYRMATTICGDDQWLSRTYLSDPARNFRTLMVCQRLRDSEVLRGLLHTLIHEVYTHGEVEFILPLFERWLTRSTGIPAQKASKTLAWIIVHTAGTEESHFRHAISAVERYQEVSGEELSQNEVVALFRQYLQAKAAVMSDLESNFAVPRRCT